MNLYMDKQYMQGNDSQTVTIAFKKYMQPNKTVTKNYSQNEVCVHKQRLQNHCALQSDLSHNKT